MFCYFFLIFFSLVAAHTLFLHWSDEWLSHCWWCWVIFPTLSVFHSICTHIHSLSHACSSRTLLRWFQIFIHRTYSSSSSFFFLNAIYLTNFTFSFCFDFFVISQLIVVFCYEDFGFSSFYYRRLLLQFQRWSVATYWTHSMHSTHCSSILCLPLKIFKRSVVSCVFLICNFQTIHKNYNTCTWNNSNIRWNKQINKKRTTPIPPNSKYFL